MEWCRPIGIGSISPRHDGFDSFSLLWRNDQIGPFY